MPQVKATSSLWKISHKLYPLRWRGDSLCSLSQPGGAQRQAARSDWSDAVNKLLPVPTTDQRFSQAEARRRQIRREPCLTQLTYYEKDNQGEGTCNTGLSVEQGQLFLTSWRGNPFKS